MLLYLDLEMPAWLLRNVVGAKACLEVTGVRWRRMLKGSGSLDIPQEPAWGPGTMDTSLDIAGILPPTPADRNCPPLSLSDPALELSPIHLKNLCMELMPDSGVNPAVSGLKAPMGITLARVLWQLPHIASR